MSAPRPAAELKLPEKLGEERQAGDKSRVRADACVLFLETMLKLTPFLLFDGTCADAMAFYQSCLGGELELTKAGDSPMKEQFQPAQRDKIIHARLRQGAIEITASDWFHPTRTPRQGNTVCLYLTEANGEGLKAVFEKLATGADPSLLDPLRAMPFGSYGALTDKFGVRWMFQGSGH